MDVTEFDRDQTVAVVGAVAAVGSGLFPWVGGPTNVSITPDVSAALTVATGFLAATVLLAGDWEPVGRGLVLLLGTVTLVYSAYRFVDPRGNGSSLVAAADTAPGPGLYLGLVGGVLLLTAGGLALVAETSERP